MVPRGPPPCYRSRFRRQVCYWARDGGPWSEVWEELLSQDPESKRGNLSKDARTERQWWGYIETETEVLSRRRERDTHVSSWQRNDTTLKRYGWSDRKRQGDRKIGTQTGDLRMEGDPGTSSEAEGGHSEE